MNTYYQYIEVTDYGPYVTKLILCMPDAVAEGAVNRDTFSVYTEIYTMDGKLVELPEDVFKRDRYIPSKGYRKVLDAYPSDAEGNQKRKGNFVTLKMAYGPLAPCSSALAANFRNGSGHEHYVDHVNTITQTRPIQAENSVLQGLVFTHCAEVKNPDVEKWNQGITSDPDLPFRYGSYIPQRGKEKYPLIVWLHGAGEGGSDLTICYSGNKTTALAEDPVQDKLGGCYIFAPQCPTMWMDDGSHTYQDSGKSVYTRPLKRAIDEFVRNNACGIDTDRIYIGGDSNGGFMTMRMILDYPDFFAAAFPICEAMPDSAISDEELSRIVHLPIWFTHGKDDPLVVPEKYVLPTYKRLMQAGAENVHFTFWDGIYDMHGLFQDENGNPYRYLGHFAQIPVFNNDCRLDFDGEPVMQEGKELTLFDWLALQKKKAG